MSNKSSISPPRTSETIVGESGVSHLVKNEFPSVSKT
jgi:hypothetical protein